jgi:hypothetical protein
MGAFPGKSDTWMILREVAWSKLGGNKTIRGMQGVLLGLGVNF